jgi:hypothetical protein
MVLQFPFDVPLLRTPSPFLANASKSFSYLFSFYWKLILREISAARALCVSLRMCVCTYVFVVVCIGAQIKRCSRSGEQELKKTKNKTRRDGCFRDPARKFLSLDFRGTNPKIVSVCAVVTPRQASTSLTGRLSTNKLVTRAVSHTM